MWFLSFGPWAYEYVVVDHLTLGLVVGVFGHYFGGFVLGLSVVLFTLCVLVLILYYVYCHRYLCMPRAFVLAMLVRLSNVSVLMDFAAHIKTLYI